MRDFFNEIRTLDYWRRALIHGTAFASFLILLQIFRDQSLFQNGLNDLLYRSITWGLFMSFLMPKFKKSLQRKTEVRSRKMKLRYALIPFGVSALVGLTIVGILIILLLIFGLPTNDRDNADPQMQSEMVSATILWGGLAPFPATAKDFTIKTEGGMFTRTFRGSFSDDPENILNWLKSSRGFQQGEKKEDKIILKTGEGAAYGEIILSPDNSRVIFRVSWS
jgi:hypothetical protein